MTFPHWVVGQEQISSQFNAWKIAANLNTVPHFYFYEKEYDRLDWTKEPTDTWDQLCYDRCMQLRLKYKKLSLFYSAGRDSHHILRCFDNFKIPLDEIVLLNTHMLPARQYELHNYIIPQAHKFIKNNPETKVLIVDVGEKEFEKFFPDDWLERASTALMHGYYNPTNFGYLISQVMKYNDQTHGVIVGADKPRIIRENDKFYSVVLDKTIEVFLTEQSNLEFFYYAPDLPELYLKQVWMTLNHIISRYAPTQPITSAFLNEYCGNSHSDYYDDFCLSCGRGPAWDLSLGIQNGKSKYMANGKSTIFLKNLEYGIENNWESARNFSYAMDYLKENYAQVFNKSDPYHGTIGVYGKKYYLKDA